MTETKKEYSQITKDELIKVLDVDKDTDKTKSDLYKEYEKSFKETPEPEPKKETITRTSVHIDDFLDEMAIRQTVTPIQRDGFKAYMQGKHYLPSFEDFYNYFQEYTN